MSRQCERPGCAEPATVAFGFDPAERMVWFAASRAEGPQAGGLCRRHADAMRLPNGWWLDDRRGGADALFAAEDEAAAAPPAPPKPKPRARRPRAVAGAERLDVAPASPEVAPAGPAEAEAAPVSPEVEVAEELVAAWTPSFDAEDDLGGQLQASTPLLSRAFGRGATLPPTPSRSRKPPAPGPVG